MSRTSIVETVYALGALPTERDRIHVLRDQHGRICHSMQRIGETAPRGPSVLLPIDGSARALRAVESAIAQVLDHGWAMCPQLLYVQAPLSKEAAEVHFHARALEAASAAIARLARAQLGGYLHAAMGEAAPRIAALAKELGCVQILMATHGHTGAVGVLLGSVAQAVLARTELPLTLVR